MKKLNLIFNIILLIVFDILAFVIPFNRNEVFIVNLLFVNISIILNMLFIIIKEKNKRNSSIKFLNLSILNFNYIYIFISIIIFIIFSIIPIQKIWIPLILNIIILLIVIFISISMNTSIEYIETLDKKVKENKKYLNLIQLEVELIFQRETNLDKKNKLKELIDVIKYSDPMSVEEVKELENDISNKIAVLKKSDSDFKLIDEIKELLIERNKKIKILK